MPDKIRIGAVSYLNTKPLVYGLERGMADGRLELSHDVPAALTRRMKEGELDIALLPVVSLSALPHLELVPGLGITTYGPALSVLLLARKPLTDVRSVSLDPESNTSNVLTRVLFDDVWGAATRCEPGPLDTRHALEDHDAVVRIGDKALFEAPPAEVEVHDLGEAWTRSTGLPFVFAAWAARPGIIDREIYAALHASRREGRAALQRIAEGFEWKGRREPELVGRYLRHHIHYRLGGAELRAVRLFLQTAAERGLIDRAPEIRLALSRQSGCHTAAAVAASEREDSEPWVPR
jgi:chorismate dehydratase